MRDKPGLVKIVVEKCPDCGCEDIKSEVKEHQHCCGDWNEYRTFLCGHKVHFCPNFGKVKEISECERSEKYRTKMIKREEARKALVKLIENQDVDEDWKTKTLYWLPQA